jgi:hypothetical protein
MSDKREDDPVEDVDPDAVDDLPTVSCERCGREWDLGYELEDMAVGNQAVEQFALDHQRHTGHFPDGLSTWQADCRHCPESVQRLEERAARRFAETHARHTGHTVAIEHADWEAPTLVEPSSE